MGLSPWSRRAATMELTQPHTVELMECAKKVTTRGSSRYLSCKMFCRAHSGVCSSSGVTSEGTTTSRSNTPAPRALSMVASWWVVRGSSFPRSTPTFRAPRAVKRGSTGASAGETMTQSRGVISIPRSSRRTGMSSSRDSSWEKCSGTALPAVCFSSAMAALLSAKSRLPSSSCGASPGTAGTCVGASSCDSGFGSAKKHRLGNSSEASRTALCSCVGVGQYVPELEFRWILPSLSFESSPANLTSGEYPLINTCLLSTQSTNPTATVVAITMTSRLVTTKLYLRGSPSLSADSSCIRWCSVKPSNRSNDDASWVRSAETTGSLNRTFCFSVVTTPPWDLSNAFRGEGRSSFSRLEYPGCSPTCSLYNTWAPHSFRKKAPKELVSEISKVKLGPSEEEAEEEAAAQVLSASKCAVFSAVILWAISFRRFWASVESRAILRCRRGAARVAESMSL
eukprot:RCo053727